MGTDSSRAIEKLVAAYGETGRGGMWPTRRQWETLFDNPHEGRVALHKFIAGENTLSATEFSECVAGSAALVAEYGAVSLYEGDFESVWIGDSDEQWTWVQVMEFPSRDHLIRFLLDPRYEALARLRERIVSRQKTLISHRPD